jgi:hypothetical protein
MLFIMQTSQYIRCYVFWDEIAAKLPSFIGGQAKPDMSAFDVNTEYFKQNGGYD